WIVRGHRSGADDDGVRERAHPMQVDDVFLAGHELRIAGMRGDETIQTLTKVADGNRVLFRGAADGQVQVDERCARVVSWKERFPAAFRLPGKGRAGVVS